MKRIIAGGAALGICSLILTPYLAFADASLVLTAPSNVSVGLHALLPATGGIADDNTVVAAGVATTTPFSVRLQNIGATSSDFVRINPVGADAHLQLWVLAPDTNWYDVSVIGYGELAGMVLTSGFDSTVSVYPIAETGGDYPFTINLALASDPSTVLSTTSLTVHADSVAPVITLGGTASTTVTYGSSYVDAGASTDDGSTIVVGGATVDTSTLGDYVITYNSTDAFGNVAVQQTRTVHVVKAASVTNLTCSASVTYSGAAQTPCTASVTGAGGLNQSVSVVYGNNLNAGTATADASFAGDANHEASSDSDSFNISPKSVNVTADAVSKVYGSNDPSLTYQVTGLVAPDVITAGALTRVAGENVGTYAISAGTTFSAGSNYSVSFTGSNLTVTQKPVTVSLIASGKTYDASTNASTTFILTGRLAADIATLSATGTVAFADANQGVNKTVSATSIALTGTSASNYSLNSTTANAVATITARALTVTADAQTKVYGAADPSLTYLLTSGVLQGSDAFSGSLSRAAGTNVGTYAIGQGTLTAGSNYAVTFVSADLTVTKKDLTATANNKTATYGDADPVFDVSYTGFVGVETASVIDTPAIASVSGAHVNVGTYSIVPTGASDNNYSFSYSNGTLTVNALPVIVTANSLGKSFGAADPVLTHNNPLINGDLFSGALTRDAGESVGVYNITQGTLDAGSNYSVTFVPGTLTVSDDGDPVINLIGDSSVSVWTSNSYSDLGSNVSDNVDTNLVATVTGSVNTSVAGTYTLSFDAVDTAGNHAATVTRTVIVKQAGSGGGSGGSGSSSASSKPSLVTPPVGEVLGAASFDFSTLTQGQRQAMIAQVHVQLRNLISQLIALLQQQLASANASQN